LFDDTFPIAGYSYRVQPILEQRCAEHGNNRRARADAPPNEMDHDARRAVVHQKSLAPSWTLAEIG